MVAKLVILALFVAVVAAQHAARYPAGVDPHTCPNYPNCDNVALAAHSAGHHAVAGHAHYAAPVHAAPAYGHHAAAPGPAHALPAGVDPHACPNYPYCGPTPAHVPAQAHHGGWAGAAPAHHGGWAGAAPAHHGGWAGAAPAHAGAYAAGHAAAPAAAAQYPAGVNPHACPNYPYCQ